MQETYTEVLCEASEELLYALNSTPQRYIPDRIQGCMLGLRGTLIDEKTRSSNQIEYEAEGLIDELDELSGSMPVSIIQYVRNLRTIISKRGLAS